jgi:hypothetical protein
MIHGVPVLELDDVRGYDAVTAVSEVVAYIHRNSGMDLAAAGSSDYLQE